MTTRLLLMPAVHFVLVGAALFAVAARVSDTRTLESFVGARRPVVVTAAQIERLRVRFAGVMAMDPTPEQLQALIDQSIDEDILYHEALARGLDQNDRHIRMRLIDKTRFITEDEAAHEEELYREADAMGLAEEDQVVRGILIQKMRLALALPGPGETDEATEAELLAYRDAHRERFTRPGRVAFTHVFLRRQPGEGALLEARRLLELLRSGADPGAESRGDAFALGNTLALTSQQALATSFGQAFADQVMTLEPRTWSGPLPSTYGWHLVRIEAKEATALAPLDDVRNQLRYGVRAERRERRVQEAVRRLRNQYEVRIERRPQLAASDAAGRRGRL